jgi:PAS domain S-box-containing protein
MKKKSDSLNKRTSKVLKDYAESLFKVFWENSTSGMRLTDKDGIIINVNSSFCRLFEKSKEELIGKHFSLCYDESHRKSIESSFAKRFNERIIEPLLERKIKLWNGKEIWFELSNSFIESEDGNVFLASIFRDITVRKNNMQKIIELNNKNEALLKTAIDGIHVLDLNGNLVEFNQSFLEHLGYTADEAKSLNVVDWDVSYSREELLSIIDSLKSSNKIFESRHKRKSGEIRDVEISASGVTINEKSYIFCSCRDITERKIAEEFIKESEERFRSIFLDNPVIMMIIHPETGKIIDVNPAACKFYGFSREEFINSIYSYDLNVSSKQDEFRELWLSKNRKRKLFQVKHKLKDGMIKDVEIYSGPISIRNKKLILSVINDVTERMIAEENVMKLSRVIEQSPVSILITDTNGIIQYVNPAFVKTTGYSETEVCGKKPNILKSGLTKEEVYAELWSTITAGKDWFGEFINKKKNGDLIWEKAIISPIADEKGQIINFVAIKEDISELKQIMDDLKLAKEEAEKSDRLKSEFLAQISHEIRTPINVIINFMNFIKEEINLPDNEDFRLAYSSIDSASRRIIRTIDLILNMSELQVGSYNVSMKLINIYKDILQNLIIEFSNLAEDKGLKLNVVKNTDDFMVFADEYSVSQIFSNLLDNAVKYTKEGFVKIIIERDETEKLVVKVADSGIGISEEYIKDLFKPFSQEQQGYTRKYEGNGLGLALVKKYCTLNNAEIKVESRKGEGSTFIVIFN